ncbi:hypothetical protein EYC84_004763 [Monilinia fructicola]|uniref:HIG1 domain-containing protein n=1 Tax=Monilinia fructicola TaxID=38448 RepID=A0A5M9K596_MONFR|nr:hypothetical protein EYC84_004763 [Monilinia fructicola]
MLFLRVIPNISGFDHSDPPPSATKKKSLGIFEFGATSSIDGRLERPIILRNIRYITTKIPHQSVNFVKFINYKYKPVSLSLSTTKSLNLFKEAAHYNATVKGGSIGGIIGLAVGGAALYVANARFQTIRGLTIPMKSFLVSSTGTFTAIICADRASRSYEWNRDPQRKYKDKSTLLLEQERANETTGPACQGMGEGKQIFQLLLPRGWLLKKLVQARVYAQGLTLAVLVASAAFEMGDAKTGTGRWEPLQFWIQMIQKHKHLIQKKIHHEAYEGEDLWRDMVEAEERRINNRKREAEEKEHSSELKNAGKAAFADAKAKKDKNQAE